MALSIAELTEQLRVERDRHQEKDRLYLKGLADLKDQHAAALAAKDEEHARAAKKHAVEIDRLKSEHDKALAVALAETPAIRSEREAMATLQKEHAAAVAEKLASFRAKANA